MIRSSWNCGYEKYRRDFLNFWDFLQLPRLGSTKTQTYGWKFCNFVSIVATVFLIENKGLIATKTSANSRRYHFL